MRSEYEKFRNACKKNRLYTFFTSRIIVIRQDIDGGYGKLRRKDTKFIRLGQEHMPYAQGIFIDIMPYDNVPDGYLARKSIN